MLLHQKEDKWTELRNLIISHKPQCSNLPGAELVLANKSLENIRSLYKYVRAELGNISRFTGFVQISKNKFFFSVLDKFLRVKVRHPPNLESESCKVKLRSVIANLIQVRIYNHSLRKLVVLDLEDNLEVANLSIPRLTPTNNLILCETDLSEFSEFKVFRMNFRTDLRTPLAPGTPVGTGDKDGSGLISLIAVFPSYTQLDAGQLSLACVKFYVENISNSLF